jgi:hypothetical protein
MAQIVGLATALKPGEFTVRLYGCLTLAICLAISGVSIVGAKGGKQVISNRAAVPVRAKDAQLVATVLDTMVADSTNQILAGERIDRHVVASGGLDGSSASFQMLATAGQTITGTGNSAGFRLEQGFWQESPEDGGDCCGNFTGGTTGNCNCSADGAINLADITRLIDFVYISQSPLCCQENGDINGDGTSANLADITRLIDHVYISQSPTAACQ